MKCQSLITLLLALGLLVSAGVGAQPKEKVLRGFDGGVTLCGFGRDLQMPVGPRVYFGVLFYR